jgi:hypothetical protein
MAVLALSTNEKTEGYRSLPTNDHGKFRLQYFSLPAVAVAGDASTTVDLCDLPPGRTRILPCMSRISTTAFGAGRTLDVGHRAYQARDAEAGDPEAEDADALIDGMDVSGAVNAAAFSTALKFDIYSKQEVTLFATVLGGTIPVAATINGFVAYIYE